ncbi:MAG: hypothetical protein KAT65_20385 [Methanophagales archaeon]|nr:hypothetical protein [Methanophagales archaeon]
MDSPSDSNISTLDISYNRDPPPCEINGCGPGGYIKPRYIAAAIAATGILITVPTVYIYHDLVFEKCCCNKHDRCYCHGSATYCWTKTRL